MVGDSFAVKMSKKTKIRCQRNAAKYYKKDSKGGRTRVHGKKALGLTAKWPRRFCLQIFKIWMQQRNSDQAL